MKDHPEKYQQIEQTAKKEVNKVHWTYNKIMMMKGLASMPPMSPELIEKLKKK